MAEVRRDRTTLAGIEAQSGGVSWESFSSPAPIGSYLDRTARRGHLSLRYPSWIAFLVFWLLWWVLGSFYMTTGTFGATRGLRIELQPKRLTASEVSGLRRGDSVRDAAGRTVVEPGRGTITIMGPACGPEPQCVVPFRGEGPSIVVIQDRFRVSYAEAVGGLDAVAGGVRDHGDRTVRLFLADSEDGPETRENDA